MTSPTRANGPVFRAVIPGRVMVLKNNKRIFGRGRKKIVIPSAKYVVWEKNAMAALLGPNTRLVIDFAVSAQFDFYFANRSAEPDVSNLIEGPQDVLVKAGVLKDDRLIQSVTGTKHFGESPRVEIALYAWEAA